jgi:hypothetical protein
MKKLLATLLSLAATAILPAAALPAAASATDPAARALAPTAPTHRCRPVQPAGLPSHFILSLRATGNLSCAAARRLQAFCVHHDMELGARIEGERWQWAIYSRAQGHTHAKLWTQGHAKQVWMTAALEVS